MEAETLVFTFADCEKHREKEDCWIIINGKVYDVSEFLGDHPGGDEVVVSATGKDASDEFEGVGHSDGARELMKKYLIGEIDVATLPVMVDSETSTAKSSVSSSSPSEMLITALQLLIPLTFLALAIAVQYLASDWKKPGVAPSMEQM